jgi:hypothetical protein
VSDSPFQRWRLWGLLAYAFYAAHAGYFLSVSRPGCLAWGCHLAALGVGTGLLLRIPTFNGMGILSLLFGVPLWLLDVFTGGEFLPTSMLTHCGGFVLGVYGVWKLGLPRFTWLVLWLTTVLLLLFSRVFTPEAENVNLAWGPPKGWESLPAYPVFGAIVLSGAAFQFSVGEAILRRLFRTRLEALAAASKAEPEG